MALKSSNLKSTKLKNRYRLVDHQPGSGGFADVWLAVDEKEEQLRAVKILKPSPDREANLVDRLWREFQILSKVEHENIVKAYEFGMDQGMHFMVMEFIDGVTFRQALRERRLSRAEGLRVVQDVLGALAYMFEQKETVGAELIVHRDIKPSNVMLERKGGRTVLLDFGIARARGKEFGETFHTVFGMGTPPYMSPEQCLYDKTRRPVDHRSDLYSVGIMLYEVLTGSVPFKDDSPLVVLQAHINEPPPTRYFDQPRPPLQPVDRPMRDVTLKSLEKDPAKRFQTAREMLEAVRDPVEYSRKRRRASSRTLAFAVAVPAFAMLGPWLWSQVKPAPPGGLFVTAEPQGILFLDGKQFPGETPVYQPVASGTHKLSIVERLDSAADVKDTSVVVPPNHVLEVRVVDQSVNTTAVPLLAAEAVP